MAIATRHVAGFRNPTRSKSATTMAVSLMNLWSPLCLFGMMILGFKVRNALALN